MPHITFSCTNELKEQIDEAVAAEVTGNRSKFIVYALEKYLSGSLSVDITPSYSQDTTKVLLMERDILHKDELLKAKEEMLGLYRAVFGGKEPATLQEAQAPKTKKLGWFARHFGKKE